MGSAARFAALCVEIQGEVELLDRLFYKNKNQHRKALYYQKLREVRKRARAIGSAPRVAPAALARLAAGGALSGEATASMTQQLVQLHAALAAVQSAILVAARHLQALLAQSFFMAFALGALAIVARLHTLSARLQQLTTSLLSRLPAAADDDGLATRDNPGVLPALHSSSSQRATCEPASFSTSQPNQPRNSLSSTCPTKPTNPTTATAQPNLRHAASSTPTTISIYSVTTNTTASSATITLAVAVETPSATAFNIVANAGAPIPTLSVATSSSIVHSGPSPAEGGAEAVPYPDFWLSQAVDEHLAVPALTQRRNLAVSGRDCQGVSWQSRRCPPRHVGLLSATCGCAGHVRAVLDFPRFRIHGRAGLLHVPLGMCALSLAEPVLEAVQGSTAKQQRKRTKRKGERRQFTSGEERKQKKVKKLR
eukprot:g5298.t1